MMPWFLLMQPGSPVWIRSVGAQQPLHTAVAGKVGTQMRDGFCFLHGEIRYREPRDDGHPSTPSASIRCFCDSNPSIANCNWIGSGRRNFRGDGKAWHGRRCWNCWR
jgi:hypothetical protein